MLDLNLYGWVHMEALGSNALSCPLLNNSSGSSSSSGGGSKPPTVMKHHWSLLIGELFPKRYLFSIGVTDQMMKMTLVKKSTTILLLPFSIDFSRLDESVYNPWFDGNDGEGLVGRSAVKTWRKKQGHQICDGAAVDNGRGGTGRASKSTYVKIKMEGVAIGRKIDASVHHSLEALTSTLMRMFGLRDEYRDRFKLTYQDREGDWMLAEDVSWRTFVRSLKCLKLIRCRGRG
ncbi:hypothetical protein V6N13_043247 [Hibiscus sabdariffa]